MAGLRTPARPLMLASILGVAAAGVATASARRPEPRPEPPPARVPAAAALPEHWVGRWSGPSTSTAPGRPPLKFSMGLDIAPDGPGQWTWTITYDGAQGAQVRRYHLRSSGDDPGRFVIDENNGIVLQATLIDGSLYCPFSLGDQTLTAIYRPVSPGTPEARIEFEVITFRAGDGVDTGGRSGAPAVRTWPVASLQRAVLRPKAP